MDVFERHEIFEMEVLERLNSSRLLELTIAETSKLSKTLAGFKAKDFKVKLGSILPGDMRAYYAENGFQSLQQKLHAL